MAAMGKSHAAGGLRIHACRHRAYRRPSASSRGPGCPGPLSQNRTSPVHIPLFGTAGFLLADFHHCRPVYDLALSQHQAWLLLCRGDDLPVPPLFGQRHQPAFGEMRVAQSSVDSRIVATTCVVAFSCKGRGACPSRSARRMCGSAAHLVDHVQPDIAVRQWVLTAPHEVRRVLALGPAALTACGRIFVEEASRAWRERRRVS